MENYKNSKFINTCNLILFYIIKNFEKTIVVWSKEHECSLHVIFLVISASVLAVGEFFSLRLRSDSCHCFCGWCCCLIFSYHLLEKFSKSKIDTVLPKETFVTYSSKYSMLSSTILVWGISKYGFGYWLQILLFENSFEYRCP